MSATTLRAEPDVREPPEDLSQSPHLLSEVLQRRAPRNIRRHWLRDVWRVAVLVAADLLVFALVRQVLVAVRGGLLGGAVADLVARLFPRGFLGGWQFAVALLLAMLIAGTYGAGDNRRDTGRVLSGVALAGLLGLYASVWTNPVMHVVVQYLSLMLVLGTGLVLSRSAVEMLVRRVRSRVGGARAVLVAHEGNDWREVARMVRPSREFLFVGFVKLGGICSNGARRELHRLGDVIEEHAADTVLLWGDLSNEEFSLAVDVALASGCQLLAGPSMHAVIGVEPKAVWLQGTPLVQLTAPTLQAWQLAAKRMMDLVGAALGLVLLSPLLAAIAAWIKLDSPGPVLFAQRRLGARGTTFKCFKFRSMRRDAEEILRKDPKLHRLYVENHFKLPPESDPRVTRSGRFLRKTSLDELPQLVNVLLGHMSLVGPRPIVPDEIEHYGGVAPLFLSLKPGMTGAWAVNGRSDVGYPDRAKMELGYIRNWALSSDLGILVRTVPAVFQSRGAH